MARCANGRRVRETWCSCDRSQSAESRSAMSRASRRRLATGARAISIRLLPGGTPDRAGREPIRRAAAPEPAMQRRASCPMKSTSVSAPTSATRFPRARFPRSRSVVRRRRSLMARRPGDDRHVHGSGRHRRHPARALHAVADRPGAREGLWPSRFPGSVQPPADRAVLSGLGEVPFLRRLRIVAARRRDEGHRPLHPDVVQPGGHGHVRIAGPPGNLRRSCSCIMPGTSPIDRGRPSRWSRSSAMCSRFRRRFGNSRANGCICGRRTRHDFVPDGNNQLGVSAIAGGRIWGIENKIRVRLGALRYDAVSAVSCPAAPDTSALGQIVRSFVGPAFDFDLQLVLSREEIPRCQLRRSAGHAAGLEHMAVQRGAHR